MSEAKILLVEDEEHLAFTLNFNLQSEGYTVTTVGTLREARQATAHDEPHLIVLDVMLPDGEGYTLCQELRTAQKRLPILLLTAKGTPEDIVKGLEAGADDYVTKPFVLKELLARIKALLRRHQWQIPSPKTSDSVYQFAQHSVNFDTYEVKAHGHPIELTPLEIRLLRYFVEHEDQVISRETLLEEVWGVSGQNYTRTVDNFLMRLRRTFEEDPTQPRYFLTVRGAGYRFLSNPTP